MTWRGPLLWALVLVALPAVIVNWWEWQRALLWVGGWWSRDVRAFLEFLLCGASIAVATAIAFARGWFR